MRFTTIFALVALLGTAAACTDTDPIDGGTASVSATITDDASSQAALQGESATPMQVQADGQFSGRFSSAARAAISTDGETWVDLGSPSQVTVALQSSHQQATVHNRTAVATGTYTRVRLTLTNARAELDAGAMLGGISFASAVSIRVGGADQQVVIEKQVEPFTIRANTHARIQFDLNSEGWVNQQAADHESAEDPEVQESTTAHRELDGEAA